MKRPTEQDISKARKWVGDESPDMIPSGVLDTLRYALELMNKIEILLALIGGLECENIDKFGEAIAKEIERKRDMVTLLSGEGIETEGDE